MAHDPTNPLGTLCVTLLHGQGVTIGDDISITVLYDRRDRVRLRITARKDVPIQRERGKPQGEKQV